ncbi:hypothetical protein ACQP2U_42410 (plasmid) [Nocardia sp. CA-084685]|uniref:hypothetical protein n=1 Tax=Nocardia sp. CA-084685 TaxID=3239970 RepID=UPI003D98587F
MKWRQEIIRPDMRRTSISFLSANDWDQAEALTRSDLAHLSTDWHVDASVHEAAAYVTGNRRSRENDSVADTIYRYAAWQRAAKAATDSGRSDWHEWATRHAAQYDIRREEGVNHDHTTTTAAVESGFPAGNLTPATLAEQTAEPSPEPVPSELLDALNAATISESTSLRQLGATPTTTTESNSSTADLTADPADAAAPLSPEFLDRLHRNGWPEPDDPGAEFTTTAPAPANPAITTGL